MMKYCMLTMKRESLKEGCINHFISSFFPKMHVFKKIYANERIVEIHCSSDHLEQFMRNAHMEISDRDYMLMITIVEINSQTSTKRAFSSEKLLEKQEMYHFTNSAT